MKTILMISAALGCAVLGRTAGWQAAGEERVTIVLRADGSGAATNATVQSRATTEQSLRWFQQFRDSQRAVETGEDEAVTQPRQKAEPKPFTDADLLATIGEATKMAAEQAGLERKLESARVTSNEVRTVWSQQYTNLQQFAEQAQAVIAQSGVVLENVRLEGTNDQLRVTLWPSPQMKRYSKTMRERWKAAKFQAELTWILPGKVLSSSLPEVNGNATSIKVNSEDEKSIDAFVKLHEAPIVITAELNGLKIAQPLESKAARRASQGAHTTGGDLPIADAGPGFVAEPLSVTTSTLTLFPAGEEIFKGRTATRFTTGAVVRAKLFPPKGRTILSVSEARVIKAVDDKGRALAVGGDAEAQVRRSYRSFLMEGEKSGSAQIELNLQLPGPEAESIAELGADAVVVTVGKWKEFTITNLQANATNEFDLTPILAGAKLTLKKVTRRQEQMTIEAQVNGPAQVRDLDFQGRQPGARNFHSYANNRRSSSTSDKTSRTVQIQCSSYGDEGLNPGAVILVIRYPDDLRRERVPIKLSNLDLL